MDADLRDLLAAWSGGDDLDEPRRAELLDRLRRDEAFRLAFVAEVRLLGMLRAVQAVEPRWLLLEDELGWSARPAAEPLEDRVLGEIHSEPAPRPRRRWAWLALPPGLEAFQFV